jgi:type III restriction enzyme
MLRDRRVGARKSGLVKIPQLALSDTTGQERPDYFNVWDWIVEKKLTPAEKGGRKSGPKPEAILKYAFTPIALLAGQWRLEFDRWRAHQGGDGRPPVFIIVCKNTAIAKVVPNARSFRPSSLSRARRHQTGRAGHPKVPARRRVTIR